MEQPRNIRSSLSIGNRALRLLWMWVWRLVFRPSPRVSFAWRRWVLVVFGAKIAPGARVYNSTRIWAPWNLTMAAGSILADDVDCYNVAPVTLEEGAIVSQYAYLCTAGHDVHDPAFPLITGPIVLRRLSWIGAKAIVSKNVAIEEGAVVGLGTVVVKSVPPWTIVGGNPAREIGRRRSGPAPGNRS